MNNLFVYCEITEEGEVADVSLELLTRGRKLADKLERKLEAVILTDKIGQLDSQLFPYGVDVIHYAEDKRLQPYSTIPHAKLLTEVFNAEKPEIALLGATAIGRDLAPRVASALKCGLTADCTSLEIGDHTDKRANKEYKNLLYQIRPAFGGNIIATIINPETRPQMATVREGVMKMEVLSETYKGKKKKIDVSSILRDEDFVIKIIDRHVEQKSINIKNSQIIISGGYGVGSKENFSLLFELANTIGAQVGASRAAVDAGFVDHERQVGQTGVTVRPKLYIACGISGAVQHRAGMDQSAQIISINTDPHAPINQIADYTIVGNVTNILPKMIKYYKQHAK